jgi:putative redox protein
MTVTERTVKSRWTGGMRAVVSAGHFELVADEPTEAGGTDTGPQPTELLLASIASCFTLALAYWAKRRSITLEDLEVDVTGHYAGSRFDTFRIVVRATSPRGEEMQDLIKAAKKVCYVTRTLESSPEIEIVTG